MPDQRCAYALTSTEREAILVCVSTVTSFRYVPNFKIKRNKKVFSIEICIYRKSKFKVAVQLFVEQH